MVTSVPIPGWRVVVTWELDLVMEYGPLAVKSITVTAAAPLERQMSVNSEKQIARL